MPDNTRHTPLIPVAGLVILLIAGVAAANLYLLVNLYENAARSSSTLSALQYGLLVTRNLEQQPFISRNSPDRQASEQFERVVDALQAVEPGLEYVSVSESGAVVYHKQARLASEQEPSGGAAPGRRDSMIMGRKKILLGTNMIPVITFTRACRPPDGRVRDLQVAFRKDVFEREHAGAATAITAMFRMALLTLVIAFGLCLLAIAGLVRRELIWQKRRRLNEHLAFAGVMAGSIIHDFRNPMSALRLDAQLLQNEVSKNPAQGCVILGKDGSVRRPRPTISPAFVMGRANSPSEPPGMTQSSDPSAGRERVLNLAGRITQTIERMDTLLGEFLIVYKPDAAARERFDLNACVRDCIELVERRFAAARIKLAAASAPAPLAALGYSVQFKRALLNVLSNAEHFSPPDSTVTVQIRRENNEALITVSDEGPGVPRADRGRIFEMFFSRRPDGTGVGLALARIALENCGGSIGVETPPSGKGSRFVIRLPIQTLMMEDYA